MFSSSMLRVARAPTTTPFPVAALSTTASSIAAASSNGFVTQRTSQRRYSSSSSKPPVPPSDGSRGIDTSSQTPAKGVNPSAKDGMEKKASKRRGKDNGNGSSRASKQAQFVNLPSVPSTQHLHPNDIHVASFFSIHRPMSVTASVPSASSTDAFSSIFSSTKQTKPSDVIYTLSSAVNGLETAVQPGAPPSAEEQQLRAAVAQASTSNSELEVTHLDGVPMQDLQTSIQEFAKRLRPFHPPPPPVPMETEAESTAAAYEAEAETEAGPQQNSYSTVLTIRETVGADGRKSYQAHTTPFVRIQEVEEPRNRGRPVWVRERFPLRHRRRFQFGFGIIPETMRAISVKRQRKLKMKKHKYKKLMRKTRNLRRRLEKN